MNIIIFFVVLLWAIRVCANLLSYIHLWYKKEYRWDRMMIHVRDPGHLVRLAYLPYQIPPPMTPKTVSLFISSSITLILIFLLLPYHWLIKALIIDLASFIIVSLGVTLLTIPTWLFHRYQINRAVSKLRSQTSLTVIGITGSFGKTSTKENAATILSSQFEVLKTSDSKNSPIGIAEVILHGLQPRHQVFVVEMGAYKRGEIMEMCKMVRPQIGILTAINPQHQDLFGSIGTTMKAKYELIQSLPLDGVAIFNGDNEGAFTLAQKALKELRRVWIYTKEKAQFDKSIEVVRAEDIKVRETEVEFTIKHKSKQVRVVVPILGAHHVSNILAAATSALAMGMKFENIAKAATKIRSFKKTMQRIKGINGSVFINDTFNNNPDAAIAAIAYLASIEGKKILVFQPMIELGKYAESSHIDVGAYAASVCDEIILTNSNYFDSFVKKVDKEKLSHIKVLSAAQTADLIKKAAGKGVTVLFKGKDAQQALNLL